MSFEKYLSNKKALIISLDDALFPAKDYQLQVYYLFAEFMAYSEQIDAKAVIDFMGTAYANEGEDKIFEKTAAKFQIPNKYQSNFELLHETARLPLKLLLYNNVLTLLKDVVANNKQIFILAEGNPAIAINKIKQTEWNGLEAYLKIYFSAEYENSNVLALESLLVAEDLKKQEVVLFTSQIQFESNFVNIGIDCFSVTEIL